MAYFAGPLLKRKIEEYDLADLDQVLADIAGGTGTWPAGGCLIPTPPVIMEATRIVLYSMLHSYGLKDAFVVKAHYDTFELSLDMRHKASNSRRPGGIKIGSDVLGAAGYRSPLQDVPEVAEDLSDVFSEELRFADGTTIDSVGSADLIKREEA